MQQKFYIGGDFYAKDYGPSLTEDGFADDPWPPYFSLIEPAPIDPHRTGNLRAHPHWTGILMRESISHLDRSGYLLLSAEQEKLKARSALVDPTALIADPRNELEPLFAETRQRGQNTVLVTFPDAWTVYHRRPTVFGGSLYRIGACSEAVRLLKQYIHPPGETCMMFDDSGRWRLFSAWEHVTFLVGEPDFIQAVIDRQGGMAEVRRWADMVWRHRALDPGWQHDPDTISAFYREVGWADCPADDPSVRAERAARAQAA